MGVGSESEKHGVCVCVFFFFLWGCVWGMCVFFRFSVFLKVCFRCFSSDFQLTCFERRLLWLHRKQQNEKQG